MRNRNGGTTTLAARRGKAKHAVALLEHMLGVPIQAHSLPPPLDVLIATVLSQNTNDKNSHRAYLTLRRRFATWEETAGAPMRSIASAIRSGGMAAQKSRRIKEILGRVHERAQANSLRALRSSSNEEAIEWLTTLPGVGPKTAACVLLFSFGRDIFPVDTHVHRVCGRLGLAPGARTPEETFRMMANTVPRGKAYSFHTNLIRFGRMVCRSSRPLCGECPLYELCIFEGKTARRRSGPSPADHHFMLLDNVAT